MEKNMYFLWSCLFFNAINVFPPYFYNCCGFFPGACIQYVLLFLNAEKTMKIRFIFCITVWNGDGGGIKGQFRTAVSSPIWAKFGKPAVRKERGGEREKGETFKGCSLRRREESSPSSHAFQITALLAPPTFVGEGRRGKGAGILEIGMVCRVARCAK